MVAYFYEDLLVLSIVDIFGLICCFENNYFFRLRLVFSLYKKKELKMEVRYVTGQHH